jgi:hypothetical protein
VSSAKTIGRRTFFRWSLWAGVGGAIGLWGLSAQLGARRPAVELARRLVQLPWTPADRLRREFHYLDVPDAVVEAYLKDYSSMVEPLSRFSLMPDEFFTNFLLSTDFFQHNADTGRTLAYVRLYGPRESPCYNPFAAFD